MFYNQVISLNKNFFLSRFGELNGNNKIELYAFRVPIQTKKLISDVTSLDAELILCVIRAKCIILLH